jgi:hypothetical protein
MPDRSVPPLPSLRRPLSGLYTGATAAVSVCRSVAFWLAICLPVAYPVTLATALHLLPALLAVHVAAVALGHGHDPETRQSTTDREPRRQHAADRAAPTTDGEHVPSATDGDRHDHWTPARRRARPNENPRDRSAGDRPARSRRPPTVPGILARFNTTQR